MAAITQVRILVTASVVIFFFFFFFFKPPSSCRDRVVVIRHCVVATIPNPGYGMCCSLFYFLFYRSFRIQRFIYLFLLTVFITAVIV